MLECVVYSKLQEDTFYNYHIILMLTQARIIEDLEKNKKFCFHKEMVNMLLELIEKNKKMSI